MSRKRRESTNSAGRWLDLSRPDEPPSGASRRHADGTACWEGIDRVPAWWVPCCERFRVHTFACDYDIRYEFWELRAGWFTIIPEQAAGGGISIVFCPHCGTRLPVRGPSAPN